MAKSKKDQVKKINSEIAKLNYQLAFSGLSGKAEKKLLKERQKLRELRRQLSK